MMNYYFMAFKKAFEFTGRSRRTEYWMFILINICISFVLGMVDGLLFGSMFFGAVYSLLVLVPTIALSVRRLHDINFSGWWFLLVFLPLLGGLALLIMFCLDSKNEAERFGANPKVVAA